MNAPDDWTPLRWEDVAQRGGLLLGAVLFGAEAFGLPFLQGRYLATALALLLATMIVAVLVFDWRMMGDWRDPRRAALLVALIPALALPLSVLIAPTLAGSIFAGSTQQWLDNTQARLARLPLVGAIFTVFGALLTMFLATLMMLFVLASRERARGGLIGLALVGTLGLLALRPSLETLVALTFLALFFAYQWEAAVVLPPGVRAALTPEQYLLLSILAREGTISLGEARLHLRDDARQFQQLTQLQLVVLDPFSREVVPGPRMESSEAVRLVGTSLLWMRRVAWIGIGLIYFAMPDLMPGPVDDMIVLAITSAVGLGFFGKAASARGKGFTGAAGSTAR